MMRWRANVGEDRATTASGDDNNIDDDDDGEGALLRARRGGVDPSSGSLHSSEADPRPGETTRLDAEYGEARPPSPTGGEGEGAAERLRSRLRLSPLSRTALTIRTMQGAAAVHPKPKGGGGGTRGSGGESSSPPTAPAPPWRFSRPSSDAGERPSDGASAAAAAAVSAADETTASPGAAAAPSGPPLPGVLADPVHGHSFAPDSSLLRPLWGTVRRCSGCGERLRSLFGSSSISGGGGGGSGGGGPGGGGGGKDGETVRCGACGALAHRGCAFSSRAGTTAAAGAGAGATTMPPCEANAPLVAAIEEASAAIAAAGDAKPAGGGGRGGGGAAAANGDSSSAAFGGGKGSVAVAGGGAKADAEADGVAADGAAADGAAAASAAKASSWDQPFQAVSRILQENVAAYFAKRGEGEGADDGGGGGGGGGGGDDVVWKGESDVSDRADAVRRDERALAEIERRLSSSAADDDDSAGGGGAAAKASSSSSREGEGGEDASALLGAVEADPPPPPPAPPPEPEPRTGAVGAALGLVRTARRTDANVRAASAVGAVAGGVAGLALAGPAGAMVGAKLFQTAGVLGALLDGTMSVGVVVAGATVGRNVAESVSAGERVLTIGGGRGGKGKGGGGRGEGGADGEGKLVLVRRNVVVDPVWGELAAEAKRSAPCHAGGGGGLGSSFVANHRRKVAAVAREDRRRKDADIVGADEHEIPTEEKVVLLVSSGLNDKNSLPGHVYRCLVAEYFRRSRRRKDEAARNPRDRRADRIRAPILALAGDDAGNGGGNGGGGDAPLGGPNCPTREGRRDAHGVVERVTESLLEVRPGLGSSARLAERTAAAAEALVFGEIYRDVFGEIVEECRDADEKLLRKIGTFEAEARRRREGRRRDVRRHAAVAAASGADGEDGESAAPFDEVRARGKENCDEDSAAATVRGEDISVGALGALLRLPEATAPADKLALCVEFLECVSVHFSSPPAPSSSSSSSEGPGATGRAAGADNLLKMVCEHVLVAKVPHLNAELCFLEEFARDEQLLRGREGYALVTLQAALHYLNASDDLERDIFRHCG